MISNKLTDQQVSEYFQECGAKCPFCGSYDVDVKEAEYETDYAWRPNSCMSCGSTWTDQYRLTGLLQKLSDKDEEDELEFANTELIKEIAKPATLNYYNIAWNHARKNGWELKAIISKYSVCQISENEFCVHTICKECFESGHYGFETLNEASFSATLKHFLDDVRVADAVKINGVTALDVSRFSDGIYFEVGYSLQSDISDSQKFLFSEIKQIQQLDTGKWQISINDKILNVECFVLTLHSTNGEV